MNKNLKWTLALGMITASLMACGDDKGTDPEEVSSSSTTGSSSSVIASSSSSVDGSSSSEEVASSSSSVVGSSSSVVGSSSSVVSACAEKILEGSYTKNITLCATTTYELSGYVLIEDGAKITIEAGTTIKSVGQSALIVMPGGKIDAVGTAAKPIVFTSRNTNAKAGDWAGVVIFGKAPVSTTDKTQAFEADATKIFGGTNDADSSGVMKYVRIEFGGWLVATDKELNGLTLGGVGSKTVLSHIHVHAGSDDAIEFFGGSASIDHSVVTDYQDDGWDIDEGWQGKVSYGINIQGSASDRAIEAGSKAVDQNRITQGEFEYITIVKNSVNQAFHIKDNVQLVVKKAIVVGGVDSTTAMSKELVKVEGTVSGERANAADTYFEDVFYERFTKVNGSAAGLTPTDFADGMTETAGLLNADLTVKATAANAAGAIMGSDRWYEGWTKTGTVKYQLLK